jgi:RNA polymerase sigma factor (sigma-70 family)
MSRSPAPSRGNGQAQPPDSPGLPQLLVRMRAGDREAAAQFMNEYHPLIRRRIRGKLRAGSPMRRIVDTMDIFSTVGRRLDLYVSSGQLNAEHERALWKLMMEMIRHAIGDKSRVMERLQRVEREDSPFAQGLLLRLQSSEEPGQPGAETVIARAFDLLRDPVDRQILRHWLNDHPLVTIAHLVELTPDAVRQRWHRIRKLLQERLR